jgi:hypothetical protein
MMILDMTAALAPLLWVLAALLVGCTLAILVAGERQVVWRNPRCLAPAGRTATSPRATRSAKERRLYLVPPRSSREATV